MLACKQLLVLPCINQLGSSYLSFRKLILLSVLCHCCFTGCLQQATIYCLPLTPSIDHTKHFGYSPENEVNSSNTLAKPQIPSAKINYAHPNYLIKPANGTSQRLLIHAGHQTTMQPISNDSYVTIEINGTDLLETQSNRSLKFDDPQEPLASSESKPSVVVSHIVFDEDDQLPPMSILMSDTFNGTSREAFRFTDDEPSINSTEARLKDVKNFMKLMRNSTSHWLGRSQALGATTSRRPELSPKSRKFLQEIKSKRKLFPPLSPIINTSAKPISTSSTTKSPNTLAPRPIPSNLTEGASSRHENWIDYDSREDHESSTRRPKLNNSDADDEPMEESASTNTGRKATPFRLSIERQQHSRTRSKDSGKDNEDEEVDENEGKPVVSESTTTTIEDGRGKKTVFRHGDNKLPAKLREKIIEQFLKNGGDPQNIVVSDSTITTTSQSKKKTITTVYKIVPNESPVSARGPKSNSGKKLPVLSNHGRDEQENGFHMQPHIGNDITQFMAPKSPNSQIGNYHRHGAGGKKLKKIMVTRIEVPQSKHMNEQQNETHEHDDNLGEFYSGPHETIFGHDVHRDQAKVYPREPQDLGFTPNSGLLGEEEHDMTTYKHNEIGQKTKDNAHSRKKTHKHTKNHDFPSIDDNSVGSTTGGDDDHYLGADKKARQIITLKKSPSSPDTTNMNRESDDRQAPLNRSAGAKNGKSVPGDPVSSRKQNDRAQAQKQRSQNQGKPKSGRAKATRDDPGPTLPPSGDDNSVDTDAVTVPLNQSSEPDREPTTTTTKSPTVTSSRRPSGSLSKSQQRNANSISITTKRPNNREIKDNAQVQQIDAPSASVATTQSDNGQQRASGTTSRRGSGRRGQAATASTVPSTTTTTTTTSTTTTTTTSTTTTTTTPRPRARTTTRAASTRSGVSQLKKLTHTNPTTSTTSTSAPESSGEDQPVNITDRDNQQAGPTSPPQQQQSNSGSPHAPLKSPASISRSQQQVAMGVRSSISSATSGAEFQPTTAPHAIATVANTSESSANAPSNGERWQPQEQRQQQQQQQQSVGKTRNIMMLIDFDAPPATANENFNGLVRQTFNQQQPLPVADDNGAARRMKSESQQFGTPFVSSPTSNDYDNQWRPLSLPHQRQSQQVSAPTTETNISNSRQQAPTVSVQIYNNLAREQQQQQQPRETFSEQSKISPSDVDFINQMAGNAQQLGALRQRQESQSSPMRFMLEPSISSSTSNSVDPFEDFAAATMKTRDINGNQFYKMTGLGNSSSFASQINYQLPKREAMPFLFASSAQAPGYSTGGMQQVTGQHELSRPKQQHGKLAVLPDESAQTNQMLMKVIDEIAKSALASGYQVADGEHQQTARGLVHHNYLTPSSGDVSVPAESQDVNQVGESDYDEDSGGDEDDHTPADSTHYPLSQAWPLSLADLLMMKRAIGNSRH